MTDTLTNEAPMLTEDLAFDLGDVIACAWPGCTREPAWLASSKCGCTVDMPVCDPCRKREEGILIRLSPRLCKHCGVPMTLEDVTWRPI